MPHSKPPLSSRRNTMPSWSQTESVRTSTTATGKPEWLERGGYELATGASSESLVSPGARAEVVELGDLVARELEPEHVPVLRDALRMRRLGNDDDFILEVPANHDLRRRDTVALGDGNQAPVAEIGRPERAVSLERHAALAMGPQLLRVVQRGA